MEVVLGTDLTVAVVNCASIAACALAAHLKQKENILLLLNKCKYCLPSPSKLKLIENKTFKLR